MASLYHAILSFIATQTVKVSMKSEFGTWVRLVTPLIHSCKFCNKTVLVMLNIEKFARDMNNRHVFPQIEKK